MSEANEVREHGALNREQQIVNRLAAVKYPLRVERDPENIFVHIRDGENRIIASQMIGRDAEEIVEAFNEYIRTLGVLPLIGRMSRDEFKSPLRGTDHAQECRERDEIPCGYCGRPSGTPRGVTYAGKMRCSSCRSKQSRVRGRLS